MSDKDRSRAADRRSFIKEGAATVIVVSLGSVVTGCGESTAEQVDASQLTDGRIADGPPPGEAGADGAMEAGRDGGVDGPGDGASDRAADGATPAKRPATTVRQRITGVLAPAKQPTSNKKQWGLIKLVAGEKHQRTDLLKVDATATTPAGTPASLYYMTHLSDTHIVDEESPARAISMDGTFGSAWRHQEANCTQILDAMVRKILKLHALRDMDLVLISGDCIDNNQKNELAWLLKVLVGGTVYPNSGSLDDPVSGKDNDPHDAFTAAGLGGIPWLLAYGNHDALVQGNFAKDLGGGKYSLLTQDPTRGKISLGQLGRVNTPTCNQIPSTMSPLPARCLPTHYSNLKTGSLPSDTERVHLSRKDWIGMVFNSGGKPASHGLTGSNVSAGRADCTVDPVPGLPLRVIMLDTAADTFPPGAAGIYSTSNLNTFLKPALIKAVADGVLVIVASHHPSSSVVVGGTAIQQALTGCPNVILHLCGHTHRNRVTPRPGPTPADGYWEVETCALLDWPQQGRLVELVDRRDGTCELWLTMFDYDTDHKPLGARVQGARFYALKEVHAGEESGSGDGKTTDRNVILPVSVPANVQMKLAALPGKPIEAKLY